LSVSCPIQDMIKEGVPRDDPAGVKRQKLCPTEADPGRAAAIHVTDTVPGHEPIDCRPRCLRNRIWQINGKVQQFSSEESAPSRTCGRINVDWMDDRRLSPGTWSQSVNDKSVREVFCSRHPQER
jgi:hypothetical protein